MKWVPDTRDPDNAVHSINPARFILTRSHWRGDGSWWLTDLAASTHTPRRFETQNDAREFAERLEGRV